MIYNEQGIQKRYSLKPAQLVDYKAIVGDMVIGDFLRLLPRPGPPIVAWDLERNWESIRRFFDLSPHIVYTGHGGPFETEDLAGLVKKFE